MWQIPEVGYANEVTPGDRYANEQQGLSLSRKWWRHREEQTKPSREFKSIIEQWLHGAISKQQFQ